LAQRRYALVALCLAFFVVQLDATVVNVALEAIRTDLGGTLSDQQWVVDAYTLTLAAGMLGAGSGGDRFGARRIYLLGLGVFAAASVLCALAPGMGALVAARAAQGVGAAALMPCSLALIVAEFPEPADRARALGIWGGIGSLGMAAGPVLGGVLVAWTGWPAIFLVNVPVCVVAVVLVGRFVREPAASHRGRFDLAGLALGTVALAALTGGLIELGQPAERVALAPALLAVGCLAGVVFLAVERRVGAPMVPLGLFRRPRFTPAVTAGFLFNFCLYGVLLCVSLVLQNRLGLSAWHAGLLILPLTVAIGIGATASGRLTARFGSRPPMLAGYGLGGVGAVVVAAGGLVGSLPVIVAGATVLGFCSLAMPAMTAAAMGAADPDRPGLASGVLNTARQTGGALGVAALGTLLHLTEGLSGGEGSAVSGTAVAHGVAAAGGALAVPMAGALLGYLAGIGCTVLATRRGGGPVLMRAPSSLRAIFRRSGLFGTKPGCAPARQR
jgi:DHA2 family methylenomycin A resistance protein-like MFS transporter